MTLSPAVDRLVGQAAKIFSVIAWAGLIYCFIRFSSQIQLAGRERTVLAMNVWSFITLIAALVSLICSLPALAYDLSDFWSWAFVCWCSVPFVSMIILLYPLPLFHLR